MFQVGDKIFYPMHGAGVIKAVEEKEVLGENKLYYILKIYRTNLQIMIPMENMIHLGVRQVVEPDIIDNVLSNFHHGSTDPAIYENQRVCKDINKKKMKSGDIYKGTEIIRDLTRKSKKSKLGPEDTTMLNNACQIFVSELMQVKSLDHEQAVLLLTEILNTREENPGFVQ